MAWPPIQNGLNIYDLISLGKVPGVTRIGAFGNNPDVDTGTVPEDAWTGGGRYPWLTAATSISIRSTDAGDTSSGAGARIVLIFALDIGLTPITISVTLNGTTEVVIPTQVYRINSARVSTAGANKSNIGIIEIFDTGGSTIRGIIPAGVSVTKQSIYTVPIGFSILINSIYLGIKSPAGASSKSAGLSTWFGTSSVAIQPITLETTNGTPYRHDMYPPIFVASGTDISLLVSNVSDSNSEITGAWNGLLIRN